MRSTEVVELNRSNDPSDIECFEGKILLNICSETELWYFFFTELRRTRNVLTLLLWMIAEKGDNMSSPDRH